MNKAEKIREQLNGTCIFLIGMMGSGKTTVGRVLSKSLGYYFFDRSRTWLFLSYVIAFVSLAGSAGMLVQDALLPDTPSSWTGIAGGLAMHFCPYQVHCHHLSVFLHFCCRRNY